MKNPPTSSQSVAPGRSRRIRTARFKPAPQQPRAPEPQRLSTAEPPAVVPEATSPESYNDFTGDLEGYWWETQIICVPFVASKSPRAFLRFLNDIESRGKPIFFPTVISARLDKLLRMRGYVDGVIPWDEQFKAPVFGLLRMPEASDA